jgi:hypothetical protein
MRKKWSDAFWRRLYDPHPTRSAARAWGSRFLPDRAGLLRFTDFKTALECVEAVSTDYSKHSRLARSLVEEYFDAKNVVKHLQERALS